MEETTYRRAMVVGLWIGILLFSIAVVALAQNITEIKEDPFLYGMNSHDYETCNCVNTQGQSVFINLEEHLEVDTDIN